MEPRQPTSMPASDRSPGGSGSVVDDLLDAIASGAGIPADLYTADARLDATVPNWRMWRRGAEAVAAEYSSWFRHPGTLEQVRRLPVPGGEVVVYVLSWSESGVPHAAHHCHVLDLSGADGRIAADTAFCGGRWPASLLAEMASADGGTAG